MKLLPNCIDLFYSPCSRAPGGPHSSPSPNNHPRAITVKIKTPCANKERAPPPLKRRRSLGGQECAQKPLWLVYTKSAPYVMGRSGVFTDSIPPPPACVPRHLHLDCSLAQRSFENKEVFHTHDAIRHSVLRTAVSLEIKLLPETPGPRLLLLDG